MKYLSQRMILLVLIPFYIGCGGGGGGGGGTSTPISGSPPGEQAPLSSEPQTVAVDFSYVKIIEENTDTLPFGSSDDISSQISFFIRDNKLYIKKEMAQEIQNGALFVEHIISFKGRARNFQITKYHVLKTFPAQLSLSSFSNSLDELIIKLGESSAFDFVRYLPSGLQFDLQNKVLRVQSETIALGATKRIHSFSKKLRVQREDIGDIPKNQDITAEMLALRLIDMGEAEFSTTIDIEYVGDYHELEMF